MAVDRHPPAMGDGTVLGFVLLLLDEMIAEDAASKHPALAADEPLRSWMTTLRADLVALPDRIGRPQAARKTTGAARRARPESTC